MDTGQLTFGVPIDRASYFIPTVGIAAMGSAAVAPVMWVLGGLVGDTVALGAIAMAAPVSAGWWVRRRYKIHHERQIILSAHAITYAAFANRRRVIPWHTITRVVESLNHSETDGCRLDVYCSSRRLRIDGDDFEGYATIQFVLACRLPELTALIRPCRLPADDERAIRAMVANWRARSA